MGAFYCRNRAEIAEELIDHDADPNICNKLSGVFPLVFATALGNYDVLNVLLKSPKLNLNLQVKYIQIKIHVVGTFSWDSLIFSIRNTILHCCKLDVWV